MIDISDGDLRLIMDILDRIDNRLSFLEQDMNGVWAMLRRDNIARRHLGPPPNPDVGRRRTMMMTLLGE